MDKKQKKKLKRSQKKKKDKSFAVETERRLKKQMNLFDRMPKACSTCREEFPQTRKAHMSWRVVVRNEENLVRLFCPTCLSQAKKLAEEQSASQQETEEAT